MKFLNFLPNNIFSLHINTVKTEFGSLLISAVKTFNFKYYDKTTKTYRPKYITSHSFRITIITKLIKKFGIENACDIIGHKNINTTLIYNRDTMKLNLKKSAVGDVTCP